MYQLSSQSKRCFLNIRFIDRNVETWSGSLSVWLRATEQRLTTTFQSSRCLLRRSLCVNTVSFKTCFNWIWLQHLLMYLLIAITIIPKCDFVSQSFQYLFVEKQHFKTEINYPFKTSFKTSWGWAKANLGWGN